MIMFLSDRKLKTENRKPKTEIELVIKPYLQTYELHRISLANDVGDVFGRKREFRTLLM